MATIPRGDLTLGYPQSTDEPPRCFTAYGTVDPPDTAVVGYIYNATDFHTGTNSQTLDGFWTIEFQVPPTAGVGEGGDMGAWTLYVETVGGALYNEVTVKLFNFC